MKRRVFILLMILATAASAGEPSTNRPEAWAQPVRIDGVPNLYKVADGLYRSAQPTAEGIQNLKRAGIRTVLNLRSLHSDRQETDAAGLDYEHIHAKAWHPEEEDVVLFLQTVTDTNKMPVLVHCQRGADRTGLMCALYRIAVQGWTRKEAIREMTEGGYGFSKVWQKLTSWIETVDVDAIRKKAEIGADSAAKETK